MTFADVKSGAIPEKRIRISEIFYPTRCPVLSDFRGIFRGKIAENVRNFAECLIVNKLDKIFYDKNECFGSALPQIGTGFSN